MDVWKERGTAYYWVDKTAEMGQMAVPSMGRTMAPCWAAGMAWTIATAEDAWMVWKMAVQME